MAKQNYLSGERFREELSKSHDLGRPTDELCRMFMKLVDRIATKGNFRNYSWIEDMKGDALLQLCRAWEKFDLSVIGKNGYPVNPFSYFTTCVHNSFVQNIKRNHKHRELIDDFREAVGFAPSLNRQVERDMLHEAYR